MSNAFADIAFTPSVQAAQQRDGSRSNYAGDLERSGEIVNHNLGEAEVAFIAAQRSFYLATVSETGWPYVQHRGGPVGFLKVQDQNTVAFADFAGNRQFVSVGNLAGNDRAAMILVDYGRRVRLKLLGRLHIRDLARGDSLSQQLITPGYRARAQRAFVMTVEAFDWNCPQHIPQRFEAEDVTQALAERDARIAELESQIAELESQIADRSSR